ncbi:MAG: GAF domain-containing protein, partial [Campylobacterota bacterium]
MIQYQLDECDKEPIHKLSAINSKKYLFTVQKDSYKILQTSENATRVFNKPVKQILQSSLHDICGHRFMHVLQKHLAALRGQKSNAGFAHEDYFYILHCDERFFVLEFEQTRIVQSNSSERVLRSMMQRCDLKKSVSEMLDTIVSFVREVSGFDRVMAYRFDQDYNGTIVSQKSRELQEDFLNHKFPASDIPAQARELYIKNRFRVIDDVHDLPAAVVPERNPATGEVLDMSFCYFRAVSRIHIQYLQNMGVGASMSLSIVVNDRLWGMIVCHHPGPRSIPACEFGMYDLISRYISKQIEQKQMIVHYEKSIQNSHR